MQLIDLTPIALSAIALIAMIIAVKVIPLIKERFSSQQIDTIYQWVKIAVKAAEQLCKDHRLDPDERLNYVKEYISSLLLEYGFTIDFDKIEKMIEAVVSELPKTFESTPEKIE